MTTIAQSFGFTSDQLGAIASKAFDLVEVGDLDGAEALFTGLIGLDPNEAAIHAALGSVLQEQGKIDEAVAAYDEAIRLEAYSPLARVNRGELRLKQGDAKGVEDLRIAAGRKSPVQGRAQALLRRFGG